MPASLNSSVALTNSPIKLNVPPLDDVCTAISDLLPTSQRRHQQPVVDITSPSPFSGKTHLLYAAVAAAVLPPANSPDANGGRTIDGHIGESTRPDTREKYKNGAAIVIDNDGCFDVARLAQVMRHELSIANGKPSKQEISSNVAVPEESNDTEPIVLDANHIEEIVTHALEHVHIFFPQSLPSLIATIDSIPSYLAGSPHTVGHCSQQRSLELIAIDNIAAFFWQAMQAAESAAFAETSMDVQDLGAGDGNSESTERQKQRHPPTSVRDQYESMVSSLRSLQTQFACPILTTNITLTPTTPQNIGNLPPALRLPSYKPLLPAVWTNFCSLRVVVQRESIKKFAPGMSVQRSLGDREMRAEVVNEGKFVGWVDGAMFEEGVEIERQDACGSMRFTFRITNEGVDFH